MAAKAPGKFSSSYDLNGRGVSSNGGSNHEGKLNEGPRYSIAPEGRPRKGAPAQRKPNVDVSKEHKPGSYASLHAGKKR